MSALSTQGGVLTLSIGPGLGEVNGGGTAEAATVSISGHTGRDVHRRSHAGQGGGGRILDDVQLAGRTFANGAVLKTHVMGQNVNGATLLGGNAGREDDDFAVGVIPEESQLGIKLESFGVVEVNISCNIILVRVWRQKIAARRLTQRRVARSASVSGIQGVHGRLRVQGNGLVLFLQLAALLPLLALNALSFVFREHLLVLHPQLSALNLVTIELLDDGLGVQGALEVGEGETTENAVIEVVVEGIRLGKAKIGHNLGKHLFPHVERDILDDNGGRNKVASERLGIMARVVHAAGIAMAVASKVIVAVHQTHGLVKSGRVLRRRGVESMAAKAILFGHPFLNASSRATVSEHASYMHDR